MKNSGKVLLAFEDAMDGGRYFFNSKTPGRSFYENVLGKVICSQTLRYKRLQNKRAYWKGKKKEYIIFRSLFLITVVKTKGMKFNSNECPLLEVI